MTDTRYKELSDFYTNDEVRGRLQAYETFLAEVIARTPEGNWLVKRKNNTWGRYKKDAPAIAAVVQNWGGKSTTFNMNDGAIKTFMIKDNLAPGVRGCMPVPTSRSPAIEFRGDTWINSWDASDIAIPDAEAFAAPELQDILTKTLRMFRENLCGRKTTLGLAEMRAAAQSNDDSELEWRFFMSWMSKPLQSIGYNMQTNMWLLGSINGLGRGTLTTMIMPLLYGAANVAELQAADVEMGGWTDSLVGKLVIAINELDVHESRGRHSFSWNPFIKGHSCEPVLKIRHRNVDAYESLNFGNWIFTSNSEEPHCLDSKDRRNALIQCFTTMEEAERVAACALALEVYQWLKSADPAQRQRFASALMHVFVTHTVDEQLIEFAPSTILKEDVQEGTAQDIKGLYWLQNDDSYPRDQKLPAHGYMEFYNRFAGAKPVDGRGMGLILASLSRRGLVVRHSPHKTKARQWTIESSLFPRESDDLDAEMRERAKAKVVSIAGLLPAPTRRR